MCISIGVSRTPYRVLHGGRCRVWHTRLVGFQFYGAVDVVVVEGFVEVPTIAEDTKSGIPAVDVPVLGVVRVREQEHRGVADTVLSGALDACVGAYEVSCLRKEVVVTEVACIDGLFWGDAEES